MSEVIRQDFFEQRPMWPFSCYGPQSGWVAEVGVDKSFEELRYEELKQLFVERKKKKEVIERTARAIEQVQIEMQKYYYEVAFPKTVQISYLECSEMW